MSIKTVSEILLLAETLTEAELGGLLCILQGVKPINQPTGNPFADDRVRKSLNYLKIPDVNAPVVDTTGLLSKGHVDMKPQYFDDFKDALDYQNNLPVQPVPNITNRFSNIPPPPPPPSTAPCKCGSFFFPVHTNKCPCRGVK